MTDSPRASAATPAMRPNERGTRIRVPRSFGRIAGVAALALGEDRKSTRLNSSHSQISYAVFCLKKKKRTHAQPPRTDVSTPDKTKSRSSTSPKKQRTLTKCKFEHRIEILKPATTTHYSHSIPAQ